MQAMEKYYCNLSDAERENLAQLYRLSKLGLEVHRREKQWGNDR